MKIDTYWDLNALSQIKSKADAAKAFEEEFLHILLKEVRKGLEKDSTLFGHDFSAKMYWDMFDMQIAKAISDSDQLGIKEYIQNALNIYEEKSK
ncbi:rod-binding protein [Nitratiruptor sp. YY09-18]|uniref:rod-binding protein n=1 Tax=Nitratiruptor sp. YY09-18 TaxID=2724901 RepID=UPI001914FF27|nr:rod-binding protein [Nitratiruptor sp. YY09-18]BCD68396.1 flagellar protein FlgJ [Nitratiruptor sp. YY09-18]